MKPGGWAWKWNRRSGRVSRTRVTRPLRSKTMTDYLVSLLSQDCCAVVMIIGAVTLKKSWSNCNHRVSSRALLRRPLNPTFASLSLEEFDRKTT
jgi:hypothetical protein